MYMTDANREFDLKQTGVCCVCGYVSMRVLSGSRGRAGKEAALVFSCC